MRRDPVVDFFIVEESHIKIDERLRNWARWCRPRFSGQVQPMFRQYRSAEHWEGNTAASPIDTLDAAQIQKGVSKLPEPQMRAINWNYVSPSNPRRAAQGLGVSMEGLALLVRSGRVMLINRRT
jgi:hypothetical protein